MEPIAARAQPITNVTLMTLLILTPMSWLVSKSFETARIAIPIFVLLTRITSNTTRTTVRIGVMNVTIEVEMLPIVIVLLRNAICG